MNSFRLFTFFSHQFIMNLYDMFLVCFVFRLDKSKVQQQEKVMEKVQERKKKKENTPEIQTIHVAPAYSGGDGGTGLSSNTWNTEMHI